MNFELEKEFSKVPGISQIEELKAQIDKLKPLPADIEGRVMQKLRLEWNYNSNAIEGNKLNYGETVAFLMTGITAKGKPLKDYLDIKGHNEAINFLLSIVKETRPIIEADIRALHKMILIEPYKVDAQTADGKPTKKTIKIGEYKTQANHVRTATGETHYYTTPEETPAKMQELMRWYHSTNEDKSISPIITAALFHHKFVEIHPFDDGNGRLSRILMNLVLMQSGYPPAIIKMDDRQNYYALLSQADAGSAWSFIEYIIEQVQNSLQLYLKAMNGGDIDEHEDIDKELALLKIELKNKIQPKKRATKEEIDKVLIKSIFPLIDKLAIKLKVFEEFFVEVLLSIVPLPDNGVVTKDWNIVEKNHYPSYEHISDLIKSGLKLKSILVSISLNEFKNPENVFNVSEEFEIEFDDNDYFISNNGNLEIEKFYFEQLDNLDEKKIITEVIDGLKYWIDENFK